MSRFDYVRYDEVSSKFQETLKKDFTALEDEIERCLSGSSRAKSLAMTKLEEAYMWVGKGIRDDQIARGGDSKHLPERDNS